MTAQHDLDRALRAWFDGDAISAPPEPFARVIESTRRMRPRPALTARIGSHWVGGSTSAVRGGAFSLLAAALLLGLLLALIGALLLPGSPPKLPAIVQSTASVSPAPTATPVPSPTPVAIKVGEPWIAYQSPSSTAGSNDLYLIRPDGRDQHRVLTISAGHPDWSPDGKRIAFDTEDDSGIWTVNADGTDLKALIDCDAGTCAAVAAPAWSPDGKQVAFHRYLQPTQPGYERAQISIEVLDLASGRSRIVAASPPADTEYVEYFGPRWSLDGKEIVFMVNVFPMPPADDNVRSSAVAVVKADGSEADAPRIITDPVLWAAAPDWSPDGKLIVFNSYPINYFQASTKASNLYTIRPDGTDLTQITNFGDNDVRAIWPSWTPDGTQIVFTHITPDGGWGDRKIAFMDPDGSNITVVPTSNTAWLGRLRPTP